MAAALGKQNGQNAASLAVAEKYVGAFQELARTNNTLILPANTGDVSSMVAQAMTVYSKLQTAPGGGGSSAAGSEAQGGTEGGSQVPNALKLVLNR